MTPLEDFNRIRSANGPVVFSDNDGIVSTDAIVFDFDSTLADVSALVVEHIWTNNDIDAFHAATHEAAPIEHVVKVTHDAARNAVAVLVVTARRERYAEPTIAWLVDHNIPVDRLYMRSDDDPRPDIEAKRDILAQIERDGFRVVHAFEDSPRVFPLYDELGIPYTEIHNPQWLDPRAKG